MFGDLFVDPIRALIFAAGHLLGGSLGAGVLAASLLLRLALLPLTLRLARRSMAQQRILHSIAPQLQAIQKRHGTRPDLQLKETTALYRRSGYQPLDAGTVLGSLAQMPLLGGLYAALRRGLGGAASFGWISDLARPDAAATLIVAGLTAAAGLLGAHATATTPRGPWIAAAISGALSLLFLWHASAAIALSWGASSAVSAAQGLFLAREDRRRVAP